MTHKFILPLFAFLAAYCLLMVSPAFAEIVPWQINFPKPVTPTMEHIISFHNMMLYIITAITLFVMGLLIYVIIRFNAKANPVPSTTTHNIALEVLWTIIPVIILIVIAVPSFKLLFFEARNPEPELTVKVTGYQWYWGYEYPDNGDIQITSYMLKDNEIDASKGQKRLLSVDNAMVIPVDTNVLFQVTATDVLHAFAVPQFGIKIDAVPGRLNSTWARVTKTGTYYGQCSELCGKGHAFMPIEIRVVTKEEFAEWIKSKGGKMKEPEQAAVIPAETPAAPVAVDAIPSAEPVALKDASTEIKTNK
jgi:cytochrome c oxidase subunit 2